MSFRTTAALGLSLFATHALASEGTVVSRHPDGRPSAIEAHGHTVRFGAQGGATCDDAIVLADANDMASRIRTQHVWLDAVHPGWTRVDHRIMWATPPAPKRAYSSFQLKVGAGEPFATCFDVSDPMVAEAEAFAAMPRPELRPVADADVPRQAARCVLYFDMAGKRMTDPQKAQAYGAFAGLMIQIARVRGATDEQIDGWLKEIQAELRSGGSPALIAEWDRCPAFNKEQIEKLQAEGKLEVTD